MLRSFSCLVFVILGVCLACVPPAQSAAAERPNLVWILSEDSSKHYFRHFDPNGAATPNIESLAASGVTFERCFSNAPVCSVARTTLLTGCYGPRIGTQFHRASVPAQLPETLTLFTERLRQSGYYATNQHKEDYNVIKPTGLWDQSNKGATWRNREPNQPFFHVQTFTTSHESSLHFVLSEMPAPESIAKVVLPPYLPEIPVVWYTRSRYLSRIEQIDEQVGSLIKQLADDGLLENTFIFYFGDHGGVLPRSKGYLYESGLHVPLVVRVPEKYQHLSPFSRGTRTAGFVEFVDFAATALELAGLSPAPMADGRPFLGKSVKRADVEQRDEAFAYADRFDEKSEMVRSLRKGKFKYIRSFEPFSPDALFNEYRFLMPAYRAWREAFDHDQLNPVQRAFFEPKSAEQLYDLEADPHEVQDLSQDPAHQQTLVALRQRLRQRMLASSDLSLYPEAYLATQALGTGKTYSSAWAFGQARKQELAELLDIADLALEGDRQVERLVQALNHPSAWHRYRAAIASHALAKTHPTLRESLRSAASDQEPLVAARAIQSLVNATGNSRAPSILDVLRRANSDLERLEILNCMVQLNERRDQPPLWTASELQTALPSDARGELKRRVDYFLSPIERSSQSR